MAPKKTVFEEAFNAFKAEVERNSRHLVEQLLKKINRLEDENNQKMGEIIEENERIKKYVEEQESQIIINKSQDNIRFRQMTEENQRTLHIEISKPTFYGNYKDQHPIDFLQNLEKYFRVKQINNEKKLLIIRDCLRNAAGDWFATVRFQIRNYSDFRDVFIDEFWSREIQIQTWSSCLNTSQVPSNVTYREHFAQWSAKLRHLQVPQISEEEIVTNIASHYPG